MGSRAFVTLLSLLLWALEKVHSKQVFLNFSRKLKIEKMYLLCQFFQQVEKRFPYYYRFYLFFRERGREGERGEEKHQLADSRTSPIPYTPQLGTWPATPACALWRIKLVTFRFRLQSGAQSTEPRQPGRASLFTVTKSKSPYCCFKGAL